jgi:hypothetical protein
LSTSVFEILRPDLLKAAVLWLQVDGLEAPPSFEALLADSRLVCFLFESLLVQNDLRRRRRAIPVLVNRPAKRVLLFSCDLEVRVYSSARVYKVGPMVPLVVPGASLVIPRPQEVMLVDGPLVRV